jgi:hypothetical protein
LRGAFFIKPNTPSLKTFRKLKMENKKIKTFEDLKVYQMAREFRAKVTKLIKRLPDEEKFSLIFQVRKAKLSITNNPVK